MKCPKCDNELIKDPLGRTDLRGIWGLFKLHYFNYWTWYCPHCKVTNGLNVDKVYIDDELNISDEEFFSKMLKK